MLGKKRNNVVARKTTYGNEVCATHEAWQHRTIMTNDKSDTVVASITGSFKQKLFGHTRQEKAS